MITEFFVLSLLASVSPILTLTALWQVKEWRIDRMREHLRAENVLLQLFGKVRLVIACVLIPLSIIPTPYRIEWSYKLLILLCIIGVAQILLRKQRRPVWTLKAIVIIVLSLLITSGFVYILYVQEIRYRLIPVSILALVPYLQPVFIYLAWLLLLPEDRRRKKKVLRKATRVREQYPDMTVIGITGSVGKTTVKELLAHLLFDKNTLVTPEHVNTEMGVAKWFTDELTDREEPPKVAIVEMGAYRKGEIRTLCSIAKPTIGVITFVGKQHIALFGSQENLTAAKGELIEALPEKGFGVLNGDNALCANLATKALCPVQLVGTGGTVDIEAFDIEELPMGIRFTLDRQLFIIPIHGTHNVTNVLLAITVARHLGISLKDCARKLKSFSLPERTFAMKNEDGVLTLDDTHNASPASFRAAIEWAKHQPYLQKTLLTSGLIELGTEQEFIHTEIGALAADVFTRVIFTEKNGKNAFQKGFGSEVELLSKETKPIESGSLLVCEGRMNKGHIARILPHA